MKIGGAHVAGLYTYPSGSGTQLTDGADVVEALGFPAFKFYCTQNYATDYPLHTWSSAPTTCKQLLQTTEVAAILARSAFTDFAITMFSFANPANNWWRDSGHADNARLQAEYDEFYDAAVHLLSLGKRFVLQNWEGDWALMDSFTPSTYVKKRDIDYCLAFHSARQRAVRDAMRNTAHTGGSVRYAVEVNRVLDVVDSPGYARLCKDVLNRLKPDVVSFSAYEPTIAKYGYFSSQVEWEAKTRIYFPQSLDIIKQSAPESLLQIGEYGFEEERIAIDRPSYDAGDMTALVAQLAEENGVEWLYYWQTFDNEADGTTPTGVKGYWLARPDGSTSLAAAALQGFL